MLIASGRSRLAIEVLSAEGSAASRLQPAYIYPPRRPYPAVLPPMPEMPTALPVEARPEMCSESMEQVRVTFLHHTSCQHCTALYVMLSFATRADLLRTNSIQDATPHRTQSTVLFAVRHTLPPLCHPLKGSLCLSPIKGADALGFLEHVGRRFQA